MKNTRPEDWVSKKRVCEELNISPKTFSNKKSAGEIPAYAIRKGLVEVYHLPTLKGFK